MTKNTAELSERLMRHRYFLQEPGKSMTRQQVSTILNAHLHRQGAYHVDRPELERAVNILLTEEYQWADPVSILSDVRTFSFGVCQLKDKAYKKKRKKENRRSRAEEQIEESRRQYQQKYATDPAFRVDVKIYREKFGAARRNEQGEMEIYDNLYHKCWCTMVDGRLQPVDGEISQAPQPAWKINKVRL
jgi:sulfur relay (sulfurtransferase) DsrC/TusE family protein